MVSPEPDIHIEERSEKVSNIIKKDVILLGRSNILLNFIRFMFKGSTCCSCLRWYLGCYDQH